MLLKAKYFISLLLLLQLMAKANVRDETMETKASQWLSSKGNKGFIENKGQVTDMQGVPAPYVLYKAASEGFTIWITEDGITLQTSQLKKIHIPENEYSELTNHETEINEKPRSEKYINWERIDIELVGAIIKKENVIKENPSKEYYNFFYPHCPNGIYETRQFEKITIKEVYPGIDWVWYNHPQKGYKYDFAVQPWADYKQIELLYKSKQAIKINQQGQMELYTDYGSIKENTPVSFYNEQTIPTQFKLKSQKNITINGDDGYETSIKFFLPDYSPSLLPARAGTDGGRDGDGLLVIDPQLVWATFYGGNSLDGFMSIDSDINNNIYITGYVSSDNFPVLDPGGGAYFQGTRGLSTNGLILRFSNGGNLTWATFYGGGQGSTGTIFPTSIACDFNGNIYITGYAGTSLPVFPRSGAYNQPTNSGGYDAFILRFTNTGVLNWATYYGGSGTDKAASIACDVNGNIYITGSTDGNFPTEAWTGAHNQAAFGGNGDAFLLRFTSAGILTWATYYGGPRFDEGYAVSCDINGNIYVTGYTSGNFPTQTWTGAYNQTTYGGGGSAMRDVFILRFTNTGIRTWATYYGGNQLDEGMSIACDAGGNIYLTGYTGGNFPLQVWPGAFNQAAHGGGMRDAFILRFTNTGTLTWATYYGGNGNEYLTSYTYDNIAVDSCGNVFISFSTESTDLYTYGNVNCGEFYDSTLNGGADIFLLKFNSYGNILWATYFGGDGEDFREALAVDKGGNLFLAGEWTAGFGSITSNTYPIINPGNNAYCDSTFNGGMDDGCIARFDAIQPVISTQQINGCNCTGMISANVGCGAPPYTYTWSNGISGTINTITGLCPGTYSLTIRDASCMDTALYFILSETSAITSTITAVSCGVYANNGITYTTSGIYTQTLSGASGCDSILTINLTIDSIVETEKTINICEGESEIIHGIAQNTTGIYTQTYTGINGCDSISVINLLINPSPEIVAPATSYTVVSGETLLLSSVSNYNNYFWSTTETTDKISVSPTATSIYCVKTVSDKGCADSVCINVIVEPSSFLCNGLVYIPNAFSPNNDGENDKYCIYGEKCIKQMQLTIYNRWGEKIFESTTPGACWDGTYKGKMLGADVFVYHVSIVYINDEIVSEKGNIVLMR